MYEPPAESPHATPPSTNRVRGFINRFRRHHEDPHIAPRAPITPTPVPDDVHEVNILNFELEAQRNAAKMAQEEVTERQREGSMFNPLNWARKTRYRLFEEYYRQNYIREAVGTMRNTNNVYITRGEVFRNAAADATQRAEELRSQRQTADARIEQVSTGELIHGQDVRPASDPIKSALVNDVIAPIVEGFRNGAPLTEAQIQEQLRVFVQNNQGSDEIRELFGPDSTKYNKLTEFFASDIERKGRAIAEDIAASKYALNEIGDHVAIKLGNVNWAGEEQIKWSLADRVAAKYNRTAEGGRFRGWVLNPAVLGATTAIIGYGGMRAIGYAGKGILAATSLAPGAGIIVGAATSAVRSFHNLNVDQTTANIADTYNEEAGPDARRRRRLLNPNFTYDKASRDVLRNGGDDDRFTLSGDRRGIQQLLAADATLPSVQDAILDRIAEIKARLDHSVRGKKDLIRYEDQVSVERNQLELLRDVVQARQRLRDAGMAEGDITDREDRNYGEWNNYFDRDKGRSDRRFNVYRLKRALVAGAIGGAVGATSGFLIKEAIENFAPQKAWSFIGVEKAAQKVQATRELFKKREPIKVGDLILTPGRNNVVRVTLPNGEVANRKLSITDEGNLSFDGKLHPEIRKEFEKNGFDVDTTKIKDIREILSSSTPLSSEATTIDGHDIYAPEETTWVPDSSDPTKWNLVSNEDKSVTLIKGLSFAEDGTMSFDTQNSKLGESAFSARLIEVQKAQVIEKDVFGKGGLWEQNKTHIDGREWYGNNTPMYRAPDGRLLGADLNELRAYNYVESASNGEKIVVWDMSHMEPDGSFQDGNHPQSVDVQEVIKQGKAAIAFSVPDDQGNPIIITDESDAWIDGKFRLDPTDTVHRIGPNGTGMTVAEFSKLVLNQEKLQGIPDGSLASEFTGRQDVFALGKNGRPGFMETGRLVEIDGRTIFQSFATAQGTGDAPATITEEIPAQYKEVFDVNPATINITEESIQTEIIPLDQKSKDFIAPFIPIAASPRFPLEPTTRREPPEELPPPSPYSPYSGTYISGIEAARETAESDEAIKTYIRNSPYLLDTEVADATVKARAFLARPDVRRFGPLQSETLFQELFEFMGGYPTPATLNVDDGSVTTPTKDLVMPIIEDKIDDAAEQQRILQAIGKFLQTNPDYFTRGEVEGRIRVLIEAYRTVRSILSI